MWHSAQGGKEIYQLQVPSNVNVPRDWTKQSGTKVSQNTQSYTGRWEGAENAEC